LRGKRIGLVDRIAGALAEAGHRVEPVPTKAAGDATRIARDAVASGADVVISFGGDGTLNETANGMIGSRTPLATLPAGTANVLARETRLGCNPLRAARALGALEPRRVAVGLLETADREPRHFLLMAGVGFDAHIVYNLNVPLKARIGQFAYWLSAFKEVARAQDEFDVEVNGRTQRCSFALASRVRNYAGWMTIARGVSLFRDEFEVVLCEGTSAARDYAKYFCAVMTGRASTAKGMSFLRASEVRFSGPQDTRVYVQIDGEYAGRLPARVSIIRDALTLLVPRKAV
jgi:diacylglycerol kinase family enzyme